MSRAHADNARHLTDRPRAEDGAPEAGGARLTRFLRISRAERLHPAVRALHARRPAPPAEGRLAPFLRILRGRFG